MRYHDENLVYAVASALWRADLNETYDPLFDESYADEDGIRASAIAAIEALEDWYRVSTDDLLALMSRPANPTEV